MLQYNIRIHIIFIIIFQIKTVSQMHPKIHGGLIELLIVRNVTIFVWGNSAIFTDSVTIFEAGVASRYFGYQFAGLVAWLRDILSGTYFMLTRRITCSSNFCVFDYGGFYRFACVYG